MVLILVVCLRAKRDASAETKQSSLLLVLESILQDPDYLAMTDYQQLMVLGVVYSLLEFRYSKEKKRGLDLQKDNQKIIYLT